MIAGERGTGRTRTLNDICLQGRKICRADKVDYRKACAERVPYLFLGLVELPSRQENKVDKTALLEEPQSLIRRNRNRGIAAEVLCI